MRPSIRQALAERDQILRHNQELRKERRTNALPDHSGRVQFSMHETDYWAAVLKNPDLVRGDGQQRLKAWQKFLNSEEGAKFKVNPHEGKRTPTHKGIILRR
jgi:hypothetical protein